METKQFQGINGKNQCYFPLNMISLENASRMFSARLSRFTASLSLKYTVRDDNRRMAVGVVVMQPLGFERSLFKIRQDK